MGDHIWPSGSDYTRPFKLGSLHVDPQANEIFDGQRTLTVRRKVMEALALLAANADRVVSKDEMLARLWRAQPASDESVTQIISELRRALGDTNRPQRLIKTVPKRGYRLVVPAAAPIAIEPVAIAPQAPPPSALPAPAIAAGIMDRFSARQFMRQHWIAAITVALLAQTALRMLIHHH
jgi:DNA-binding winged helix-turn-helix (wHTH) protein